MVEGEKTRFWIPAELAYGEKPPSPGPPAGKLVFDVELIKIMPTPPSMPGALRPGHPAIPPQGHPAVPQQPKSK